MERLEVRPKKGKLALYAFGALVFVAGGVWLILTGGAWSIFVGLFSIAFFGGGMVLVLMSVRRRGTTQLVLTPAGVELGAGGMVPWEDVEEVGLLEGAATMVGLRLRSYDRYLASLPESGVREANRMITFMKPFAYVLSVIPGLRRFARNVDGPEAQMRWTRDHYGVDIAFSSAWLDRPPRQFAELLEQYRSRH